MFEQKKAHPKAPSDWRRCSLSQITERISDRNTENNQNVLTISAQLGLVSQHEFFNKRVASTNASNYFLLKRGDFAYNKSYSNGYPLGVIRRLEKYQKGIVSPLYICFRPNQAVNPDFLLHYFEGGMVNAGIADIAKEGVRNHGLLNVGVNDFFDLEVALPSLEEQEKIAQILGTLDTAICETEAIIAKLRAIKQGLLHDLLTRGLDANGQLRPPPALAPQFYKDSPLGLIPKEWEVTGVQDIAPIDRQAILTGPFGAQLGGADFTEEGVPVLRIGNVQFGHIDWSDTQYVSHTKAVQLNRFRVSPGDLLFARQGATTGRCSLADEYSTDALINYHIIRVAVDHSKCEPIFLFAIFTSESTVRNVNQEKGRGTREGINTKQIAALRFALPPVTEQKKIASCISAYDETEKRERLTIEKLRQQKSGLMDDLLTGRVRVKVAETEGA